METPSFVILTTADGGGIDHMIIPVPSAAASEIVARAAMARAVPGPGVLSAHPYVPAARKALAEAAV